MPRRQSQPALRFHREAQPHQLPGICAALLGFVCVFIGVALLVLQHTTDVTDDPGVKVAGPVTFTLGLLFIIGGITHKFLEHKKFKDKRLKYLVSDRRPSSPALGDSQNSQTELRDALSRDHARPEHSLSPAQNGGGGLFTISHPAAGDYTETSIAVPPLPARAKDKADASHSKVKSSSRAALNGAVSSSPRDRDVTETNVQPFNSDD